MADWGGKISKAGFNVLTATNRQLIFSTGMNMFKVFATGTVSVPANGLVTITHNLGYKPNYQAFISDYSNSSQKRTLNAARWNTRAMAWVDDNNFYIQDENNTSRTALYYIMYDPI